MMESTRPDTKQHSQSSELTGSLIASQSVNHKDHSNEFYEKELKRYNVGARDWTQKRPKVESDFMYEWIRSKSGK